MSTMKLLVVTKTSFRNFYEYRVYSLNDNTLCEYFFKKSLFFNELARFGQFIEYTLFRSPFLLPRVPIWSPFHSKSSPHLVPILKKLGPHSMWVQCVSS